MKKKLGMLFKTILIALLIINMCNSICYATPEIEDNYEEYDSTVNDPVKDLIGDWSPTVDSSDDWRIYIKIYPILSIIRTIGIIVSVATLMVIGIKFMLGSVQEKAQYKQIMIPWIIGAIMVFAITTIPTLIYDISVAIFK